MHTNRHTRKQIGGYRFWKILRLEGTGTTSGNRCVINYTSTLNVSFSTFPDVEFIIRYEGKDLDGKTPTNVHLKPWIPQSDLLRKLCANMKRYTRKPLHEITFWNALNNWIAFAIFFIFRVIRKLFNSSYVFAWNMKNHSLMGGDNIAHS